MIRVLLADDSPTARRLIAQIVSTQPDMEVVGQAKDGAEAIAMVRELRPDVVTMDIRMPTLDGYEAARRIMAEVPTPVVMVSAHERAEVDRSFKAIEAGAVTVLSKPAGPGSPNHERDVREMLATLRAMAGLRLVTRRPARQVTVPVPPSTGSRRATSGRIDLIGIGASTGGPAALATIIRALPDVPPVPILLVQHIAEGFDTGLVSWLDSLSAIPVRMAAHGMALSPGEIVVAPNGRHMGLSAAKRVVLVDTPPQGGHRPSVTHLFTSLAESVGSRALGVILTGIGRDGADGLAKLRSARGRVIAQNEATCVVYGMPRAVVDEGNADLVVPVQDIARSLADAWRIGRTA